MLLKKSRIGSYLIGTFCSVLTYADDFTISCPVVVDLVVYCVPVYVIRFALSNNNITFNTRKMICNKSGEPVKDS